MKPYQIFLCGLLIGLISLSIFSSPATIESAFTQQENTPTPPPGNGRGDLPLQSGDTEGLIIGAAVIVLIIIVGVILSRGCKGLRQNNSPGSP
jgi:hypothetical protein